LRQRNLNIVEESSSVSRSTSALRQTEGSCVAGGCSTPQNKFKLTQEDICVGWGAGAVAVQKNEAA
jgi:hypothetical protein